MKYLIIDDEYLAHDILKDYCDLLPNLHLAKNCYDALEAIEYLNKHRVDLIFLDLNMPKLKGFEFLKTLPSPPKVIVTTAYREFALEGYELNIVDYLLKPFSFERFLKAVNKAMRLGSSETRPHGIDELTKEKRIFLRSNKKYIQVTTGSIRFLEAAGNYTKVFTTTSMIMVREKISDVLDTLSDDDFIQVHKSFAIAVKHIKSVEGNRVSIGDNLVPIGKTYKAKIAHILR